MANEWLDITCADPCTTGCPEWGSAAYATDPDCCELTEKSQICGVYIMCEDNLVPIAAFDLTGVTDWATNNLDNTDTTGAKAKYIVGEGEITEPTPNEVELPKGKTKPEGYTYSGSLEVKCTDEDNTINNFMRLLQKGNTNIRFWYETLGGGFYGGVNGISPDKFYAVPTYGGGREDIKSWSIKFEYNACVDAPRLYPNPLA